MAAALAPPRWRSIAGVSGSCHDGTHHRRQGDRGRRCAPRSRREVEAPARASTASRPGSRWCWSATIRRARSTSRNKSEDDGRRPACARSITRLPETRERGRAAGAGRASSTPIRRCTASWCSCRCRRRSTRSRCIAAIDPAQGRRRLSSDQCRPAGDRAAGAGAVHAARLHHAGEDGARVARRARGGGDRPLQHRRQAAGAAAARRERDGDGRAFQDARSAGGVPPRRPAVRRGRPARDGARRLDQAGRDRDRRRHQPRAGPGRQDAARRRRRLRRGGAGRGRDHAGAGRRRADDHRLPDGQHAARGLRASPACRRRSCERDARATCAGLALHAQGRHLRTKPA